MASRGNFFKVSGIRDVNAVLSEIAPREAKNLMRATVHDIAGQLAKSAKAKAPVDEGDLRRGIKARRRRGTRTQIVSTVDVVGAFYWRFLEYGDGPDGVEYAMFLTALQQIRPDVDRVYIEAFARKLMARLARERKRRGG
ncbi:HK97 gp10 family phage protein [Pontitalea aquivivens]|uniref:HK97 gp10 family phage protein n=1 Tax=Pontitalea aquivivens TaxID=3388663 RepID=UPI003970A96A